MNTVSWRRAGVRRSCPGPSVRVMTRAARLPALLVVSPSAAVLACVAPSTAMAADDQAPVAIEQVIITARKRHEDLQDIPVAATVVSTEQLDNYDLRSVEAIAA